MQVSPLAISRGLPMQSRNLSNFGRLRCNKTEWSCFRAVKVNARGNGQWAELSTSLSLSLTTAGAVFLASPLSAQAAEGLPEGTFDMILRTTEALGPFGPVFFIGAVVVCECVPLFPTTPLSLASGILFGAQKGAICILGGTTIASLIAFSVARGIGRPIAEKVISAEMSHDDGDGKGSIVQKKLQNVQSAIERGTFWQQTGAVLALRLTPVVPFSASNYVLGLSPLPLAAYFTGTFIGMSFWSVLYASVGGASRSLLSKGVDADALLAEMLEATSSIVSKAGVAVVLGAIIVAGIFWGKSYFAEMQNSAETVENDVSSNQSVLGQPKEAQAAMKE